MDLSKFNSTPLFDAATELFAQLGVNLNSNTKEPLPAADLLKKQFKETEIFKSIGKTYFIGIIEDSVFKETSLFDDSYSYKKALVHADKSYDGLMLFALELSKHPTRSEISDLTRAFNRISQKMPVALVLKYTLKNEKETAFSVAISERFKYLQNWREGEKSGKVIILRDIHTLTTHTGHIRILKDLVKPVGVTNYAQLHEHWLQVLDVNVLNKKFFQELANWYFWAMDEVKFPDDVEKKKETRNATNLIRLITRVIFIWFIKEKQLVPANLFRKDFLKQTVKEFAKNTKSANYYHAILQNLFFGTLNQKMEERKFADNHKGFVKKDQSIRNIYRYSDKFLISEADAMKLFKDVPFLNGGLFDCLDKTDEETKKEIFIDGFTRDEKHQAFVPDFLFFVEEQEIDLNETFGTKNKTYKAKGLFNLLDSYKFTVAENTPIEEEVALDPELLGKVFENLLASYNPETQTTARKQTGSFYTPREIVNYMVDEALLEHIKQRCLDFPDIENRLNIIISYSESPNPFNKNETKEIIEIINQCKILDPACGSGAFPMGVLHKMVHILQKLDFDNKHWKEIQRNKAVQETETAFKIGDKEEREKRLIEINDVFDENASDYGRKLYLIENCIFGIDIQPIAVQIAKLRFFISLVIDQTKNATKVNLGIRSLPNLETKFVAANTLIGLEKPNQDMFSNKLVDELENKLGELRHKYFSAKTRREKISVYEEDKALRRNIAELLEKEGWKTSVVRQIISFNPYDQNNSSTFFEIDWMFGLKKGFDIVIGNPPYVVTNKGEYPNYKWEGDLYTLFFEISIKKLLNKNGVLSIITPRFFLFNQSNYEMRKHLLNELNILLMAECNPFDAVTENVITILTNEKSKSNKIKLFTFVDSEFEYQNTVKKEWIKANRLLEINPYLTEKVYLVLEKIKCNTKLLCDVAISKRGAEIGKNDLKETINGKPILIGYDVERYKISRSNAKISTSHKEYKRLEEFYKLPQMIMLRRVSKDLVATISKSPSAFSKNLYGLVAKGNITPLYLLALLNSNVLNFYYKNKFSTKKEDVFPEIQTYLYEQLPIKQINDDQQKIISNYVENILQRKIASDENTDSIERRIDILIMKHYDLNYADALLIDENITKSEWNEVKI